VPPETGIGLIADSVVTGQPSREQLLALLRDLPTWSDLAFTEDEFRALFAAVEPWSADAAVDAYFAAYAARHGKTRWGEKTPTHALMMPQIARLFPDARFVHIIRDGRDVVVSLRGLSIDPGSVEATAAMWRDHILRARAQAPSLQHYREVRYDALVSDPERVLRELCAYLELSFEAGMLRAHERTAERDAELTALRERAGRPLTPDELDKWAGFTRRPPDPTRAGRWREALTPDEARRFEEVAGDLLETLGYPVGA